MSFFTLTPSHPQHQRRNKDSVPQLHAIPNIFLPYPVCAYWGEEGGKDGQIKEAEHVTWESKKGTPHITKELLRCSSATDSQLDQCNQQYFISIRYHYKGDTSVRSA
ncbi:hypothetical protein P8452_56846 [Trifolium repens]|nr:hypothetical protein P8452_56846 [Trifolium repens]